MSQYSSSTDRPDVSERGAAVVADNRGNAAVMEFWRPIIWSAVIGGMVAALGVQIVLTLFGIGVGAALIDPWTDPDATRESIGITAAIWTIVSGILSFGAGGYVAGHMSGVLRTGSGALHGVLAWAAAAVFGATVGSLSSTTLLGGGASGMLAASNVRPFTDARSGVPAFDAARAALTDEEARAAAERTADAIAGVSLLTGVAFLLSAIAAGVGGTMGRNGRLPRPVMRPRTPSHRPSPA